MAENITVKRVAEIMGKSQQFIRIGLQEGILPFGKAMKLSTQWTYHISPKLFYEYIGEYKEIVEIGQTNIETSKQVGHLEVHYCPGHDEKLFRKLKGKDIIIYDEHHGTSVRIRKATTAAIDHYVDEYSTIIVL